jgi:hypothetical protein
MDFTRHVLTAEMLEPRGDAVVRSTIEVRIDPLTGHSSIPTAASRAARPSSSRTSTPTRHTAPCRSTRPACITYLSTQ